MATKVRIVSGRPSSSMASAAMRLRMMRMKGKCQCQGRDCICCRRLRALLSKLAVRKCDREGVAIDDVTTPTALVLFLETWPRDLKPIIWLFFGSEVGQAYLFLLLQPSIAFTQA